MIIDICVGVVALLSALISFMRGFIREILTIAGVVGGLAAAYFCGPWLSPLFRDWLKVGVEGEPQKLFDLVDMSIVADICAYGTVFVLVVIAISVVSHVLSGAASAMGLGPVDRSLGVIFGLCRALILLGLLYLPFHLLMAQETKDEYFKDSRTFYFIEKTADVISGFLPDSEKIENENEKISTDIKDKLLEQNILPSDKNKKETPVIPAPETKEAPTQGYKEQQREKMDKLFEQPAFNQ